MTHIGFEIIDRAEIKILEKYKLETISIFKVDFCATFEQCSDGIGVFIFFESNKDLQDAEIKNLFTKIKGDFLKILKEENYPFDDFPNIRFEFDSDENVRDNYEGSYFYRLR